MSLCFFSTKPVDIFSGGFINCFYLTVLIVFGTVLLLGQQPRMTFPFRKLHWGYIRNNPQSVAFTVVIYLLFTLSLFVARCIAYWCTNLYLVQARACGQVLNFFCAFILIMILRKTITILRSVGMGRYLPLDHYVYFHKLTGWSIAFFSTWHTVAHLGNFWSISRVTSIPYLTVLVSPNLNLGWIGGLACISGWLLCLVLILMCVLSMNFIRRSGKFEVSTAFVHFCTNANVI